MKRFLVVALLVAVAVHAAFLLFGGLLINAMKQKQTARIEEVEILQEEKKEEEKPKEEERDVRKVEKLEETPEDQMPDATVLEELDTANAAPALEAVSLADLESALSGGGGASDFARGVGFGSGGVIGGTGTGLGGAGGGLEGGGSGALDQKPRLISSVNPEFPAALRKRGGSIVLLLFVNEQGRVSRVSVEKATDPALEAPATEAARRWVFEPGTRGGKRAPFKTRQTIRIESANG